MQSRTQTTSYLGPMDEMRHLTQIFRQSVETHLIELQIQTNNTYENINFINTQLIQINCTIKAIYKEMAIVDKYQSDEESPHALLTDYAIQQAALLKDYASLVKHRIDPLFDSIEALCEAVYEFQSKIESFDIEQRPVETTDYLEQLKKLIESVKASKEAFQEITRHKAAKMHGIAINFVREPDHKAYMERQLPEWNDESLSNWCSFWINASPITPKSKAENLLETALSIL